MKPLWRLFCYIKRRTNNLVRWQVPIIQMKHQKYYSSGAGCVKKMDIDVLRGGVDESYSRIPKAAIPSFGGGIVADRDRFDRAMGHLVMQERS